MPRVPYSMKKIDENGNFLLDVRIEQDDFRRLLGRAGVNVERFLPQEKEFWQD